MEKIKYFIGGLGGKLFPGLPERKRRRAAMRAMAGVFLALACMAGMGIFRCRAVKQLEKYRAIADACAHLNIILKEGREKAQKGAGEEPGQLFSGMEADVEMYGQGHETETGEDGIGAYDWDALCSVNGDIKGWLYIPGTLINFPVTGTTDNDFYLSHDFAGDKSSAGCPFMDRDTEIWDFNRVIYGHNMGAGSDAMFSTLLDYEKEDYFRENRTFYFTDAYGSTAAYQVMAVVKYNTEDLGEWDFRARNHEDMESYNVWMEQLQERALYYEEPAHAPVSIITLATCDRREHGKNGRFLVIGAGIY